MIFDSVLTKMAWPASGQDIIQWKLRIRTVEQEVVGEKGDRRMNEKKKKTTTKRQKQHLKEVLNKNGHPVTSMQNGLNVYPKQKGNNKEQQDI